MAKLGLWLLIFGAGSIVLNLLDREFIIMMWVDQWGPTVGWIIRSAMIGVGGLMLVLGGGDDE